MQCSFLALKSVLGMGDLVPGEGGGADAGQRGYGEEDSEAVSWGNRSVTCLSLPPPPSYAPLFTLRASLWQLRGTPGPSLALPPLALPAIPLLLTLTSKQRQLQEGRW